jgi:antitoxin MazE
MIELIKIGNSQGVRIPKPLIEQAKLANKQLQFKLVKNGLLISPITKPRISWENSIRDAQAEYSIKDLSQEETD